MLIQLSHITKTYPDKKVIEDVNFTLNSGERVGLVGKNGSGKSTLFKIIAGLIKPDSGSLQKNPKGLNIGYIPQSPQFKKKQTVKDFLAQVVTEDWKKYKIDQALDRLKIKNLKDQKLENLSSGQKTRLLLARLCLIEPDVLLLDEPTNHLDIAALEWLEQYIRNYKGAILIISHDRRLLDNAVNKILELEETKIKIYGGNYSFYKQLKQTELESQSKAYQNQQKEIGRLQEEAQKLNLRSQKLNKDRKPTRDNEAFAPHFFADRASKKVSSASKTIEKRLDQLERLQKPKTDPQLRALFHSKNQGAFAVTTFENASQTFGEKLILSPMTFSISRGERIALLGSNGSGKTTLIRLILGKLKPNQGKVEMGRNVITGYLSQEHRELNSNKSVLDYIMQSSGLDKTNSHRLLSKFLIPTNKINQIVNSLSSGEKAKLLLAKIMASGANFIILDEPTNHLDIASREALESALNNYEGTLLVVSHDRYFIDNININRRLILENGCLKSSQI